ncbi:uncharacterized protein [Elaeis guineensis]|uniref:uncharacterized protein n=1 Tax=Elaeis guineensis var. tenera TaxID=51953 RepID=UPI003C6D51ED
MEGNIPPYIFENLTSLEYLDLSGNNFDGHVSFLSFANLSKLEAVILSNNEELTVHLDGGKFVPSFQLRLLMLLGCNLDANALATPSFLASQYNLEILDLSHNKLIGSFPNWLFINQTKLKYLSLRNNSLTGALHLLNHPRESMIAVDLSMNFLVGSIPENIGMIFLQLMALDLSSNHMSGNIPSSLGNLSQLQFLDLSSNNLSGEVPTLLMTNATQLSVLKLTNNNLDGKIFGANYSHPSLSTVYLDGNKFTGTLPGDLSNYPQLAIVDVHDNQLSGMIPEIGGLASSLNTLNLRGNNFHGQIPRDLCNLTVLSVLDISDNNLSGLLPDCWGDSLSYLVYLNLAGNAFTGTIPNMFFNITELITLDARDNRLSGQLPNQIGDGMLLEILVLRGNLLEGPMPIEFCKLRSLHLLDLSQNNLSGSIPSCLSQMQFKNMEFDYTSRLVDMGLFGHSTYTVSVSTSLNTSIDLFIDSDEQITVAFNTKGNTYAYLRDQFSLLSGIDLSANKFTGTIPPELGNLYGIISLNLSFNQLTGPIPETFSNLNQIETLDLSHNHLSGVIPWQLEQLESLEVFSVAYNNLSGCTPDFKGQFATFSVSSYEGNNGLHGPPLEKTCTIPAAPAEAEENKDDGNVEDDAIFFAILAASFVAGFWGCIALLLYHPTGQHIHSILDGYVDSLTERISMAACRRTRQQRNRR